MANTGKRYKAIREKVVQGKAYGLADAIKLVQDGAKTKFVESVDVAIRLGIDAKKSDQGVRGSSVLPHGTGKSVRVAVFCPAGEKANAALAAGADAVGMDDLAEKMQAGDLNYDRVIATPDAMRVVGKLGQVLGPRGLMPNPKDGSVSADVVTAVKNAKAGQVRFRNDKAGIIHCTIGKVNFEASALSENLGHLLTDLIKAKPAAAKGIFVQKVSVSSTMGVGVTVDPSSLPLK
ncbi:MAG TPA: 50S ribosomal protein L1 [Dokdonella sp.]|uniref:50S ribosomal protein L1 n=2 Tax=Dokdonella sp. TaxID=2291710 RepID=UPI002C3341DA|nr:50S ribosomal protein L1 [Dokdonella sp.]HOX72940.1 50S ribosomal protein L1 [Dokdonella sp.]HPG95409.1 50S ribosomal protein L1 [Dokdonella sp.]HPN80438.1 50S ribosomal protein L1 [Dokdonella sp.]